MGNICKPGLLPLAFLPLLAFAQPDFNVEIVETDPPANATLNANESVYVRLKYRSNQPLRFQAAGYLSGSAITQSAAFNPAPAWPAGSGEAIAWTSYYQPATIDKIKITVSDERWAVLDELSLSVDIHWNGMAPKSRRQPALWARTLNAQQQAMASTLAPAGGGDSALWSWLLMLMGWSIPGYIVLQIHMFRKYEDHWRKLALLPLWIMIPLFAYTLFALLAGSNLWPLMMLFLAPLACVYLLAVLSIRKISGHAP